MIFLEIEKFEVMKVELFGKAFWNFVVICHLTKPAPGISIHCP
jgi:hypothetical protein